MMDLVAGGRGAEMSRQKFSVAYSGRDRPDDHSIDAESLGPALVAFGRLIREANSEFNDKRAAAKVLVVSDFEHKCFNINFEVVMSVFEHVKSLIGDDKVSTAKDILEWIGLVKPIALSSLTYLGYLKWKNGRKVINTTTLVDQDKSGFVGVQVEGEHNPIVINQHVYNMSINPKALKATRDALSPVGSDGFDSIDLRDEGHIVDKLDHKKIDEILSSCNAGLEEIGEESPEVEETSAWLSVYSPVYDLSADKWRFKLGKEPVYVDISETEIARDALARGGALADDAYFVTLQVTTPKDKSGKIGKQSYKIIEVRRFIGAKPTSQGSLFDK
ncbi:hypothetical protein IYY11_13205 [Methylocystis sp. H62]|uniref:hypothetical protein n=1 Tax=Methylocystis sp. H62 TaxID=2785789 RepID=UPI0018C1FD07|nr:hypothetical protein [Methylocystis sp. H62]MBG0794315.1 hypothetical protein [Methylocystis sp. H62]